MLRNTLGTGEFLPHSTVNGTTSAQLKEQRFPGFRFQYDDVDMPGSFEFFTNDTKERFQENLNLMPEDWHYRTKPVVYNFNKQGYRTVDLDTVDWANSVVMFGCSELMGTGLAEDERICFYLEQLLGVPVINLGKNGTSVHFSAVNNHALYKRCKRPLGVINQWTEFTREAHYAQDRYHTTLPNHTLFQTKQYKLLNGLYDFTVDDWLHNLDFYALSAIESVRNLWDGRTKYAEGTWNEHTQELLGCAFINRLDWARDVYRGGDLFEDSMPGHLGRRSALKAAEQYAELLNI